jgi:hypothetical protein
MLEIATKTIPTQIATVPLAIGVLVLDPDQPNTEDSLKLSFAELSTIRQHKQNDDNFPTRSRFDLVFMVASRPLAPLSGR